jgi:hypothetical protein
MPGVSGEFSRRLSEHDKHIDTLSHAIEDLAATNSMTNIKIDKLVEAMGSYNVLTEKVDNISKNIVDSFTRRDDRIEVLERVQRTEGCSKIQIADNSIRSVGKSLDAVRESLHETKILTDARMESIENKIGTFVGGTVVRWAIGLMVTGFVVLAGINERSNQRILDGIVSNDKSISILDKLASEKISMQREKNKNIARRLDAVETYIEGVKVHD